MPTACAWLKQLFNRSPLLAQLSQNASWSFLGSLVARGSTLLSTIILARLLSSQEFGSYGIIQSTVLMAGTFAGFGLGLTATRFVAELKDQDPERTARIIKLLASVVLITSGAAAALVAALSAQFATQLFQAPQLAGLLALAALLILFNALNSVQLGVLAGLEAFKRMATVNCAANLLGLICVAACAYFWRLPGAILALILRGVALAWLAQVAVRRAFPLITKPRAYREVFGERTILFKFTIPALVTGFFGGPVLWCLNALLTRSPNGLHEMALVTAASQWQAVILFLPGAVAPIFLPSLAQRLKQEDGAVFKTVLRAAILTNGISAGICALPVVIFSHWIMRLYGTTYTQATTVLMLYALLAILTALTDALWQGLISRDRIGAIFISICVWALAALGAFGLFVTQRSALTLIGSLVAAQTLYLFCQALFLAKGRLLHPGRARSETD